MLAVTGDHGMVAMAEPVDYDDQPSLREGVALLAGEPRVRYLHVRPGALDDVRAAWTEVLGEGFWIGTREQIVDSGSLGADVPTVVADRIGDLVVVATSNRGVVRRRAEPVLSGLIGQHGSWTDAERLVALGVHREVTTRTGSSGPFRAQFAGSSTARGQDPALSNGAAVRR